MARVMIIDDDMTFTRTLEEHLRTDGHDVKSFAMAEEGLQWAAQYPPDLFLVDVMLPDATGFQVVGRLRQQEKTKSVPIIMITGTARYPNQQQIGKTIMGADDYLLKPFNMNDFSEKIRRLLGNRPVRRTLPPVPEPVDLPTPEPVAFSNPEPITFPTPEPSPFQMPEPAVEPPLETPEMAPVAFTPEVQEDAAMKEFQALEEEFVRPEKAKEPAREKPRVFPDVRWVAALVILQMVITRSGRAVLAGWALLLGLLMAACGALRITLTAEQALGLLVWPAVPIVARSIAAVAGYQFDAFTITPQLFWTRPLDIFEMAAILILGINLRRLPGSTLLKALCASALIAASWCLTNRGYFQP